MTTNIIFSGIVRDATTQTPIAGATVKIDDASTMADETGSYTLTVSTSSTSFNATVDAAGYLPISVTIMTGGTTLPALVHFDFVGRFGLRPFSSLTAVIQGVVEDSQTTKGIPNAAVTSPGKQALTNQSGHYLITLRSAPRIQINASAQGYQWGPPFILTGHNQALVHGRLTVNFTGHWGLDQAFHSSDGATLDPFPQVMTPATHTLTISGVTNQPIDNTFAVTYPNGDASLLPLAQQGAHFKGILTFDHGPGIYQLEIILQTGFALFNLPIYVGVPYSPPSVAPFYTPDAISISTSQLEEQTLTLINNLRTTYHRPPLQLDGRLATAARAHSLDVITQGYYETHPHIGSDGSTPEARVSAVGLHKVEVEEDVALDFSVRGDLQSLMISPAHRAHLLSTLYTSAGVGIARQQDGHLMLTIDYVHELGAGSTPVLTGTETPQQAQSLAIKATLALTTTKKSPQFSEALQLLVPEGATVGETVSLHVDVPPLNTVPVLTQTLGHSNNVGFGLAFDLTAINNETNQLVHQFSPQHPILLQLSYDPADLAGLDPNTLTIAFYDPATRAWPSLPTTVDALHHLLIATTTHFTLFQIRATAHTAAQLTQARSRLATLAAAGTPHVAALPLTAASVLTLVSVPAGRQRVPLSLQITGTPQTKISIVYTLPRMRMIQSFSLGTSGYATILFTPTIALTSAQPLLIGVTATHGSAQQSTTYQRILLPGAPLLQAQLSKSSLHAATPSPLLTITTTPGALVRVAVQQAGASHSVLSSQQGTANAHGTLKLPLARLPATLFQGKVVVLHVVITATLADQSSQQTLMLSVGP